jgi:hypothetical protein
MIRLKIAVISLLLAFFILFFPTVLSQGLGLGISNYHIELAAGLGESVTNGMGIFNPSPYEETVKIYIECDNCVSDAKLFGYKIGEKREDIYQYVSLSNKSFTIRPNTGADASSIAWVSVTPKILLIRHFVISTPDSITFFIKSINKKYDGKLDIPYPALFIGEKKFDGRVSVDVVSSTFPNAAVMPSVAATLKVESRGMPFGSFVLILLAVAIVVFLIVRRLYLSKKSLIKKS